MSASSTLTLRNQHDAIVKHMDKLGELVGGSDPDAAALRQELSALARTLTVHLTMEDEALYPRLLSHRDESIRTVAKRFNDEMGSLRGAFIAYVGKWPTGKSIAGDTPGFVQETRSIIAALRKRIDAENDDLFTKVDQIA